MVWNPTKDYPRHDDVGQLVQGVIRLALPSSIIKKIPIRLRIRIRGEM